MSGDRKIKLLYLVEAMGGGVFTYIVDLANELVNQFDVYIAYAVRPETPADFQGYFDNRIHLIRVSNFCREIVPAKEVAAIKEVKQIVADISPDIVHMHSSKAGVIGRIAVDGRKIPSFYTPHGYSFLMKDSVKLKRAIYWGIEKWFAGYTCTTISCSRGEHLETLKLTKKAKYVSNAINAEELLKCLEGVDKEEHPFTVFTIGRICTQKNPELFNAVADAMPDTRFLWIGDGELRGQLKSSNINVTGWLKREEALKLSMNADVFVLTSLWEGLPISLLEAMFMKKTCAVSNVIGNRDVIHNGENGYLCESVDDYINAIREHKEEYIDRAYADVLEKYETKVQAKHYADIYMESLNRQE